MLAVTKQTQAKESHAAMSHVIQHLEEDAFQNRLLVTSTLWDVHFDETSAI
jgi:hypothetical protein